MKTPSTNRANRSRNSKRPFVELESLENRMMMAKGPWVPNFPFQFPYTINGTPGNDYITVSYSNNAILGPRVTFQVNGSPTVIGFPAYGQAVQINGLGGNDFIRASGSGVTIDAGDGNDTVFGTNGNDAIYGGLGMDKIDGALGADYLSGGAGVDTVDYSTRTFSVRLAIDGMANDGQAAEFDNIANDVERLVGGLAGDYLNVTAGSTGNYHFTGNGGNDTIIGGLGPDIMIGGYGNDLLLGNDGGDYVIGEYGNDTVRGGSGRDLVSGGFGDDVVYGDAGIDTVYGDQGNDRLYGGADPDLFYGGDNDDTLVGIGGSQMDTLRGEGGTDSFWLDAEAGDQVPDLSSSESLMNIHRVAGFDSLRVHATPAGTPSRELDGQAIADPGAEGLAYYQNFSGKPLFGPAGPRPDDVAQNAVGDCYFLASMAALAKIRPWLIRQLVCDLGDGTYAVLMQKNGVDHFLRMDADLAMNTDGSGFYQAGLGKQQSLWVPIMEKAWAFFRTGFGSWGAINGGRPQEGFDAVGQAFANYIPPDPQSMINALQSVLNWGLPLTISTKVGASNMVENHVYMVDRVTWTGDHYDVVLRNPWGYDGPGADAVNDGLIAVTGDQLFNNIHPIGITYAT